MITCEIITGPIATNCAFCHEPADPPHLIGAGEGIQSEFACARCCPVHKPVPLEWKGEPATITGTQEGLF